MLSKEWLQGCKMMADAGVMFQSDAVKSLLDHITELEENATAQALALKAAKAMQQAETERADKLQEYVLALEHDQKVGVAAVNLLIARLDVANKRADANERDAERYRYIRTKERMMLETDDGEARMTATFSSADEFDDAIDQAMSNM